MIIAPARVMGPCAHVHNGNARFTFHRISAPVTGGLPVFAYPKRGVAL